MPIRSPAARDSKALENPIDMFVGPDGLLYVVPLHEGRILRVTDDDTIEVVAARASSANPATVDPPAKHSCGTLRESPSRKKTSTSPTRCSARCDASIRTGSSIP